MADYNSSQGQGATVAQKWLSEIEAAQRDMQPYRTRCNKIRKLYRYDSSRTAKRRRFQLFWSNIETMKPAVYAQTPKAVVETRYRTGNPIARAASQLLERTIQFQFDANDFDRYLKQIRDDYLLYARGVPRLRYEAEFEEAEIEDGLTEKPQEQVAEAQAEDQATGGGEVLAFENIRLDYVQREDFIHPKCRTWEELPWISYRAYLTKKQFEKRFPDYKGQVPLNSSQNRDANDGQTADSDTDKAEIFEIWDKANHRVLWVAKGCAEVLEEDEPYLKLTGFYPSPRPAYGTLTNDSLEPIPDFTYYQDQTEEIDDLTNRIAALSDALKLVGFYPGGPQGEGVPEIERALTPGVENKMIAVKAWAAFIDKSTSTGAPIVWLPVEQVLKILQGCVEMRKQLKDDVREITGISDLMRGDTDPNETAHAQNLKAQYGSSRMGDRKKELARVARDIVAMSAEIIAEQFQLSTMMEVAETQLPTRQDVAMRQQQAALEFQKTQQQWQQAAQMAQQQGQQPPPQPQPPQVLNMGPTQEDVLELLRNGVSRRFRLDIETDSTVAADETQEKQDRTAFIQAISQFMLNMAPIVQQTPDLAPLVCQLLLFGVRAFPVARELENVVEETADKLMAAAGQPKPPPQPSPDEQIKMETAKVKGQAEIQKANTEAQTAQFEAQAKMGQTKMEMDKASQEHAMNMEAMQADHAIKMRTLEQQVLADQQRTVAHNAVAGFFEPQQPGPA